MPMLGREHRKQRKHMNTLFTANRVSKLTPLFCAVTRQLQSKLAAAVAGKPPGQVVEMLDYLTRTTLEIVGTAGIGHTPLGSRMFLVLPFLESWRRIKPVWLRRTLASIATFFWPTVAKLYKARQRLLEEGGSAALAETATDGKYLMSSMIQANWDADEVDKMPDNVVLANMGSIVHGGQETMFFLSRPIPDHRCGGQRLTTKTQSRVARRQGLQKKAPGEDLDYIEIERLPLLDTVIREMLRVYSPVTFVWRQYTLTTKDVVVPLTYPIRSTITGEEINKMLIERGDCSVPRIGRSKSFYCCLGA
ncbi:cytochrome P450 [Mycena olivaceomarginata]|nr:cytochrome P450 [Mycena olivaceomarginata]